MASVNIPADLEKQIEEAAQQSGKSKDTVVREALIRYLEDQEDLAMAEQALNEPGPRVTLDDLEHELGMDR
jgi:RHH-type rel operon transcriptional repressor/antitoxin RelB